MLVLWIPFPEKDRAAFRLGWCILRDLQANYAVAAKDLRVCRPLVNVREKTLATFAKDNRFGVDGPNFGGKWNFWR